MINQSMKSPEKIILITGCSSGFGLSSAVYLAKKNHIVYATMRNLNKKDSLLNEASAQQVDLKLRALDVTQTESIQAVVKEIEEEHGGLDVLVNNAGFGMGGYFEDLSDEDIHLQMETNFFGVCNVTRYAIPLMRKKKSATIINISSISGLTASPCFSAYNASKWALEGFTESLYFELKEFGIRVSLIEPGIYKTRIFYENARRAQHFSDPHSPYYEKSRYLKQKITEMTDACRKDVKDIACLIERIINHPHPPLRNIPDFRSKVRYFLRKIFPLSLNLYLVPKVIFADFNSSEKKKRKGKA